MTMNAATNPAINAAMTLRGFCAEAAPGKIIAEVVALGGVTLPTVPTMVVVLTEVAVV